MSAFAPSVAGFDLDTSLSLETSLLDRLTGFFNRFMYDCTWEADYTDTGTTLITVTDPDAKVGVEIDDHTIPGHWTAYRLGTDDVLATDPALGACLMSLLHVLTAPTFF